MSASSWPLGDTDVLRAVWPAARWGFAGSWIFGVGRRVFSWFLNWQPRAALAELPAFVAFQAGVALTAVAAQARRLK